MTVVLVTGGSGKLGSLVLERLHGTYRTRVLQHRRPVDADEIVAGDLTTGAGLETAVRGVEAVVHLAAVTHSRRATGYLGVNVVGTRRLVAAAEEAGVPRFVHVSTRAINPSGGAYSASKALAEEFVRGSSLGWVVLRLAEVYGAGAREGVDAIVEAARAGRTVLVVGRGAHEVCPIHVQDAADAIVGALSSPLEGVYTVGGQCTTVRAFAEASVAALGSRSRIVGVPQPLVSLAARTARVLPLPLMPDQPARLNAPKQRPSPEAESELGFRARPPAEALRSFG